MVVKVWAAGRRLAVLPLALIVASGCQGEIGANGPGSVGPGTSNPGSGGAIGGPVNCAAPSAPTLHAHLLTPSQYNNTVLDLVKVAGNTSKDFGGGVDTQLDDLAVELRANAAADVARQAATTLAQWTPCPSAQAADAACEALIIDRLGPQAYRHPLSTTERGDLQELEGKGLRNRPAVVPGRPLPGARFSVSVRQAGERREGRRRARAAAVRAGQPAGLLHLGLAARRRPLHRRGR